MYTHKCSHVWMRMRASPRHTHSCTHVCAHVQGARASACVMCRGKGQKNGKTGWQAQVSEDWTHALLPGKQGGRRMYLRIGRTPPFWVLQSSSTHGYSKAISQLQGLHHLWHASRMGSCNQHAFVLLRAAIDLEIL
jgi:hypothetical protein